MTEYAVTVTLPADHPDKPEGTTLVRRIGPYQDRSHADLTAFRLEGLLPSSAPPGTTITVGHLERIAPHVVPDVPTTRIELANTIAEQPPVAGGWGFPDLYARLVAQEGPDRAAELWRAALSYLDFLEAEREADRFAAEREAKRLAPMLVDITRAADRRPCLYAGTTLAKAARVYADVLAASSRHGVERADWTDLAEMCLDSVSNALDRTRGDLEFPRTYEVLDRVWAALTKLDPPVAAAREDWMVILTERSGQVGYEHPLVVTLTPGGWALTVDRRDTVSVPTVPIVAGCDDVDAASVAELVGRVHRGELGDPFQGARAD